METWAVERHFLVIFLLSWNTVSNLLKSPKFCKRDRSGSVYLSKSSYEPPSGDLIWKSGIEVQTTSQRTGDKNRFWAWAWAAFEMKECFSNSILLKRLLWRILYPKSQVSVFLCTSMPELSGFLYNAKITTISWNQNKDFKFWINILFLKVFKKT